jgi:hypothetical protein
MLAITVVQYELVVIVVALVWCAFWIALECFWSTRGR